MSPLVLASRPVLSHSLSLWSSSPKHVSSDKQRFYGLSGRRSAFSRPWELSRFLAASTHRVNGAVKWSDRRKWLPCRASEGGKEEDHDQEKGVNRNEGVGKDAAESTAAEAIDNSAQGPNGHAGLNKEQEKLTSGSPLPGMKPPSEVVRLPKEVLDVLQNQVFGFDTFFVTGQEPYEGGVIFKGNLRGDSAKTYSKLSQRLRDKYADQYKLFLLTNPLDDRPVAIVVPKESVEPDTAPVPEWFAAGAFGLVTVFTILLHNSPALQVNFLPALANPALLADGLSGALVTVAVLLAHEAGHVYAAQKVGAKLSFPYFIPSWQLGTFGGITRIINILPKRQDLLEVAVAGPLAGAALGLSLVSLGLLLPPSEGQGILVTTSIFHESLLVGGLAKVVLGDALKEGGQLVVNPLVLAAWSGLLINAINSIPVGELDGGRISQALWGRKVWSRINGVSVALLGLAGIFNDVSLYWVVLVLFLQRGPITPQADEITPLTDKHTAVGVFVLLLGLLVYFPFPVPFS